MTGANRYSFITSTILPARRTVSSYVRASLAWSSSGGGLLDVKWLFWFSQNCELHVLSGFSSSVPLRGKLRTTWVTEDNSEQEMEKYLAAFNLARVFHRRFVYNASNGRRAFVS